MTTSIGMVKIYVMILKLFPLLRFCSLKPVQITPATTTTLMNTNGLVVRSSLTINNSVNNIKTALDNCPPTEIKKKANRPPPKLILLNTNNSRNIQACYQYSVCPRSSGPFYVVTYYI